MVDAKITQPLTKTMIITTRSLSQRKRNMSRGYVLCEK